MIRKILNFIGRSIWDLAKVFAVMFIIMTLLSRCDGCGHSTGCGGPADFGGCGGGGMF